MARLGVVIDADRHRARELARRLDAPFTTDCSAAADHDAAIVASPTETHVDIGVDLLKRGISVLVEKPLAPHLDGAEQLVDAARVAEGALMCGFVERFNPAFIAATGLLTQNPIHIVAVRHSPAAPRIRTSVVHDLLIHDIDLVLQLAAPGDEVVEVSGHVSDPLGRGVADIADCVLRFRSGLIATLSASRASHRKLRDLQINDAEHLIDVDLLRQNVDVYRHVRHELVGSNASYREETVHDIPFVRRPGEPLALQFDHFVALMSGAADRGAELDRLLPAHEVTSRLP
jgi:predicted dehydrogenase